MKRWILPDAEMFYSLLSQIVLGVLSLGLNPNVLVGWHGVKRPNLCIDPFRVKILDPLNVV